MFEPVPCVSPTIALVCCERKSVRRVVISVSREALFLTGTKLVLARPIKVVNIPITIIISMRDMPFLFRKENFMHY